MWKIRDTSSFSGSRQSRASTKLGFPWILDFAAVVCHSLPMEKVPGCIKKCSENDLPVLNVGNGWDWGNGMVMASDYGSFPHSLLSTSKMNMPKPEVRWFWCGSPKAIYGEVLVSSILLLPSVIGVKGSNGWPPLSTKLRNLSCNNGFVIFVMGRSWRNATWE